MGLSLDEWVKQNSFEDLECDIEITIQETTDLDKGEVLDLTRLIMIMVRQKFEEVKKNKKDEDSIPMQCRAVFKR